MYFDYLNDIYFILNYIYPFTLLIRILYRLYFVNIFIFSCFFE